MEKIKKEKRLTKFDLGYFFYVREFDFRVEQFFRHPAYKTMKASMCKNLHKMGYLMSERDANKLSEKIRKVALPETVDSINRAKKYLHSVEKIQIFEGDKLSAEYEPLFDDCSDRCCIRNMKYGYCFDIDSLVIDNTYMSLQDGTFVSADPKKYTLKIIEKNATENK